MNMTRRQFLIGGAAFASLGAFAGNRFMLAAAGFKAGGKPRLRFGVLSDIHILRIGADEELAGGGNNLTFKHALEWFRSHDVDVVVVAGDMADRGMDDQLMAVAEAWYSVFPNDKYPDGRPVEKVFVTGNHDWIGHTYGGGAATLYPDETERVKHVLRSDFNLRTDSLTLLLCIDSDGKARGQLYEDDGDGFSYLSGNYRQLTFEATLRKRVLTVTLRQTAGTMPPVNRVLRVAYVKNGKLRYSSWQQGNEIVVKMK